MSKFCPNCGSPAEGAFCGECGSKLGGGGGSAPTYWSITLLNLPTSAGQPADLSVGNVSVFNNEGVRNRVNASFTAPCGVGQTSLLTLSLPAVGFNYSRNLLHSEGTHIRFQADENGQMKVRRQLTPF